MILGTALLAIINFLIFPTWHLVVLYLIIFAIVIISMVKSWGF